MPHTPTVDYRDRNKSVPRGPQGPERNQTVTHRVGLRDSSPPRTGPDSSTGPEGGLPVTLDSLIVDYLDPVGVVR